MTKSTLIIAAAFNLAVAQVQAGSVAHDTLRPVPRAAAREASRSTNVSLAGPQSVPVESRATSVPPAGTIDATSAWMRYSTSNPLVGGGG